MGKGGIGVRRLFYACRPGAESRKFSRERSATPTMSSARRKQPFMSLLGNRRESGGDHRPAITAVFAAKNFAACGAAEDRTVAGAFFETKRAEFMFQTRRQAIAEALPIFSTVFTAVNFPLGARCRSGLPPSDRIVFSCCHEHDIGISRIPRESVRIHVGRPIRRSPSLPITPAGIGDIEAGATGNVYFPWIARIDKRPMHVVEMLHRPILILI